MLDQESVSNGTKYDSEGDETSLYSSPSFVKTSSAIQQTNGLNALSLSVKVDTIVMTAITRVQVSVYFSGHSILVLVWSFKNQKQFHFFDTFLTRHETQHVSKIELFSQGDLSDSDLDIEEASTLIQDAEEAVGECMLQTSCVRFYHVTAFKGDDTLNYDSLFVKRAKLSHRGQSL